MPKPHSFPVLFDETLQLSASRLNKWGYFKPNQIKRGTLSWSRRGTTTASISISINTLDDPYIELDYKYQGKNRNYKIQLETAPSNLGKGLIWYFICPHTGKRCRKLYSVNGYFFHREAFTGMYESQTRSKSYRELEKTFGAVFQRERLYDELYSKYFKKTYAGRPTKRYLRIKEKINNL